VKLAVVVQRYGADISGGAELHARYVAEMLARRHRVEVLTTCAHDYVTWKAHYTEGTETVNGVPVRRFPVARERDPHDFGQRSTQVFERRHSIADEIAWLDSEGPTSPALIDYVGQQADAFDYFLFFSYRYYHAWHGVRRVPHKAILVPTAERDAALGLSIFAPVFRAARAVMYNSPEERAIIQAVSGNTSVPGVVVGIGSDLPRETSPDRFRRKYDVSGPFVIYVGRIDANKGCAELFDYFSNYRPRLGQQLSLLLAGTSILPIPDHPRIRHLGFISDRDKFDAIAASEALIMPSRFESLSMVALEAWGLGRPVLANGRCDVLRGQTIRSRAGLYYDDFPEFAEALFTLTSNRPLHQAFGENGRRFYERHYAWPVIQRKYEDMLGQLSRATPAPAALDALPGWLARRRRTLPPSQAIVDAIAKGAVTYEEPAAPAESRPRAESSGAAGPAPRPSPVAGRQAVRSGAHGRGRRPQGQSPSQGQSHAQSRGQAQGKTERQRQDRPKGGRPGQAGAPQAGGNSSKGGPSAQGAPGKGAGGPKGSQDRQDGRRGQNRPGRQRRPPRRNG
jgi:glycosyltransferase involved in cell wall biosynthesis